MKKIIIASLFIFNLQAGPTIVERIKVRLNAFLNATIEKKAEEMASAAMKGSYVKTARPGNMADFDFCESHPEGYTYNQGPIPRAYYYLINREPDEKRAYKAIEEGSSSKEYERVLPSEPVLPGESESYLPLSISFFEQALQALTKEAVKARAKEKVKRIIYSDKELNDKFVRALEGSIAAYREERNALWTVFGQNKDLAERLDFKITRAEKYKMAIKNGTPYSYWD